MPDARGDIHGWIQEVIEFGQHREPMPASVLAAKLFEEGGEFTECALILEGWCAQKTMKEPIEGELADCFMLLLAAYGRLYPDDTPYELMMRMYEAFNRKFAKYKDVIATNGSDRAPPQSAGE